MTPAPTSAVPAEPTSQVTQRVTWAASLPNSSTDVDALGMATTAWGGEVLRLFLERHESTVDTAAPGLVATLATRIGTADGLAEPTAWWNSAIGNARRCLALDTPPPTEAVATAARLGLSLVECGTPGDWFMRPPGCRLHVGPFLLPADAAVSVEVTTAGQATVTVDPTGTHGATRLVRSGLGGTPTGHWHHAGPAAERGLLAADAGIRTWDLRTPASAWQLRRYRLDDCSPDAVVATSASGLPANVDRALALMTHTGHRRWVTALVDELVPFAHTGDTVHSSSDRDRPGCVALTHRTDGDAVLDLVTQLAHEASHQAFFVLRTLGPLVEPDHADVLVHSAVKGRPRPLESVLLAFHAFVNILVALRSLPSSPHVEATSLCRAEADAASKVRAMAGELADIEGFTPTGAHLLRILADASQAALAAPSQRR